MTFLTVEIPDEFLTVKDISSDRQLVISSSTVLEKEVRPGTN
jgi:hypothetical protein